MKISLTISLWLFLMLPVLLDAQDTLSKKEIRKLEANYLVQDKPWRSINEIISESKRSKTDD